LLQSTGASINFRSISDDLTKLFGWPFFGHVLRAELCLVLMFGFAGLAVVRALGIRPGEPGRPKMWTWLFAPALGMCTFGPWVFLATAALGFSAKLILLSWVFFLAAALLLARRRPIATGPLSNEPLLPALPQIGNRATLLLILGASIWALLPAMNIYPVLYKDALYVNGQIFDHLKISFIDVIDREGMPAINPNYAPGGHHVLLSYSYGWHLDAAIAKRLTKVSGWEADVALDWYTGMAMICLLSAMATGICGRPSAGIWLVLLAFCGPTETYLPQLLGPRWFDWVGEPPIHMLEGMWLHMAWAPQHAFGGMAVVVLLWLTAAVLASPRTRWRYAVLMGLTAAAGFESSVWVGAFALAAVTPLLLIAALGMRLRRANYVSAINTVVPAVICCVIVVAPMLRALLSHPGDPESRPTFEFWIFPAGRILTHRDFGPQINIFLHIVLFWIQALPLYYGVLYLIGFPAMFAWIPSLPRERTFRMLALAASVAYFAVSEFLRSIIVNNDLGWRAVTVPVMFMLVWGSAALADISTFLPSAALTRWRRRAWFMLLRPLAVPLAGALLAVGILGTVRFDDLPMPVSPSDMRLHKAFAQQALAWQKIRELTKPRDYVQSNPDGFKNLPPWPINLPFHLFADRCSPMANLVAAYTYAFQLDHKVENQQYMLVHSVFTTNPPPESIRALHDDLGVKAILVIRTDPCWNSRALERSGFYRLVTHNHNYKIYIARKVREPHQASATKPSGPTADSR
jgi:hypothetical protein